MVCVGRGLYQIAIEQPELEGREDEFEYLGEITGRVDSAERPRESFSANDDLIGCSIYRLDEDIIVEYEGKCSMSCCTIMKTRSDDKCHFTSPMEAI